MTDFLTIYNQAPEPIRKELLGKLGNPWYLQARSEQIVPRHSGIHSILAGRGWGKTRTGAEWIVDMAERYPGTYMAVVGRTEVEAYHFMLAGPSGIASVSASHGRDIPGYDDKTGLLWWRNGSKAFVRGVDSLDPLRGYNQQFSWLDLGSESRAISEENLRETWGCLIDGNTVGVNPQILVTSDVTDNWLTDLIRAKKASGNPYWTSVIAP